jgi:two-component system OmpR family sensor kinase
MMLAAAALFVYVRLRADLDDRIDASLRSRVTAIVEASGGPSLAGVALEDPEETFVQLLSPTGGVRDSVGTVSGPSLTTTQVRQAAHAPVMVERRLPGVDGPTRLLAQAASDEADGVVVAGQSLLDRDDALRGVASSFLLGGALTLMLASAIGYLLATAALAPVEAMRRRAREVSLRPTDVGLPLPAARDEVRRLAETLNEMLARLRAAFEREGGGSSRTPATSCAPR